MKKFKISIIALILVTLLIIPLSSIVTFAFSINENETEETSLSTLSLSEQYDETMRRGYHIPTLEEDFKDDLIIVFLKSEYSKTNGEFDEDEFRKFSQNFASIINMSEEDIANLMADLFRQKIKITLKETGKEKVIEAIAALMEMDMVLIADPDYNYYTHTLEYNPNITE